MRRVWTGTGLRTKPNNLIKSLATVLTVVFHRAGGNGVPHHA